ncbi:MAG TPA: hypothetical protein VH478_01580 [Trebonia sp.]|nr:hypothetical protein [Trebonia sp.]
MSREAPDATFAVRVLTSGGTTAGVVLHGPRGEGPGPGGEPGRGPAGVHHRAGPGVPDPAAATTIATFLPLPAGGYATLLPDGSYKLDGDPAGHLWWAIKLCRFEAGELDPYVPGIRRLAPGTPVLPARPVTEAGYLKEQGTE